jgi:hypothetical protein
MKVCTNWQKCGCECHDRISAMFALIGEEREPQGNPDYVPWLNTWVMPDPRDWQEAVAERTNGVLVVSDHEDVPSLVKREFEITASGRASRGSLEQNVQLACDAWIKEGSSGECTTKWVSEWIHTQLETPDVPSRGAIDAVWKRWVALGFALTMSHPTQFVMYTPKGIEIGLEGIKAQTKRHSKNKDSKLRRGIRE